MATLTGRGHGRVGILPISTTVTRVGALSTVAILAVGCATMPQGADPDARPERPLEALAPGVAPLVVQVLDVGQGDAIWIENGATRILIDAGQGMGRMAEFIAEKRPSLDTIHWMILSHAHADHHGGMREFFKTEHGITIQRFLENQDPAGGVMISQLRDSIRARESRGELEYLSTRDPCGDGSAICTRELDGGARMHILPPPSSGHPNDRSLAVKLIGPDSASFSMLIAGDAEGAAMAHFKATYAADPGLRVKVLKGNHHGSCNGVTAGWLEMVDPEWTTWGVSASNGFGHVHEQTKALHRTQGRSWLRSDQNGRITFRSEGTPGSGYSVELERGEPNMDGDADRAAASGTCSQDRASETYKAGGAPPGARSRKPSQFTDVGSPRLLTGSPTPIRSRRKTNNRSHNIRTELPD